MIEACSLDRNPKRVHTGKIGFADIAGMMFLGEKDLLPGTLQCPPTLDFPLECPQLAV